MKKTMERKMAKLKKVAKKKLAKENEYQNTKEAFLILRKMGILNKPSYNLQTIEDKGKEIPTFPNIKNLN